VIPGHVDSVQPGSGTAFSLLPAQNATGNYVKIVQRVPVKIVMDNTPTDIALFREGRHALFPGSSE
jgi:membrane fusion protein (multidrug efflux system)